MFLIASHVPRKNVKWKARCAKQRGCQNGAVLYYKRHITIVLFDCKYTNNRENSSEKAQNTQFICISRENAIYEKNMTKHVLRYSQSIKLKRWE